MHRGSPVHEKTTKILFGEAESERYRAAEGAFETQTYNFLFGCHIGGYFMLCFCFRLCCLGTTVQSHDSGD